MKIIEYSEKYRDSAINLLKKSFSRSNHEDTFSWRFDNPGQYKPIIVCAVDSGNVISFNSWIKWLFTWEGKTFVGYQAAEAATDYNYRRKGIWIKVLRFGEDIAKERGYIDFFYGFPKEISFGGFIKAGYRHVGTYSKKLRIINPLLRVPKQEGNQNTVGAPGPTYLSEKNKLTPIVDSNYIEWRYDNNPKEYRIINYSDKNDVCTFIFVETKFYAIRYRLGFPVLKMLDCRFTSKDRRFIHNSFKYIDERFYRKAVWISTFVNEGTEKAKALKPHFHINSKNRGEKLMFKKINPAIDEEAFCRFDNWDLQPHIVDVR